jgi:hypothetical protein
LRNENEENLTGMDRIGRDKKRIRKDKVKKG